MFINRFFIVLSEFVPADSSLNRSAPMDHC